MLIQCWKSCVYLGYRVDLGSGCWAAFPPRHTLLRLHPGSWCRVRSSVFGGADGHLWVPVPGEHTDPVGHALPPGPREQLCWSLPAALPYGAAVWPPQSENQTVPSLEEGWEDQGPMKGCCMNWKVKKTMNTDWNWMFIFFFFFFNSATLILSGNSLVFFAPNIYSSSYIFVYCFDLSY